MAVFADAPLSQKFMVVVLSTCAAVLLAAGAGFVGYEAVTFQRTTVETVRALADIVAANSTAALAFADATDASETLASLSAEKRVVAAALYDANGRPFATYPSDSSTQIPARPGDDGYRFVQRQIEYFKPVVQGNNSRLGTLYVRAEVTSLNEMLLLYGAIAIGVLATGLLLAFLLSRRLRGLVSEPIEALTATAQAVSEKHDYSVRAPTASQPELRVLSNAFNHMLARIGEDQARNETQLGRLDLLQRTTRAIGERQDLPSVLQVIVGRLEAELPVDLAFISQYDANRQVLTISSRGPLTAARVAEFSVGETIAIDGNGLARCVRGQVVYESDLARIDSRICGDSDEQRHSLARRGAADFRASGLGCAVRGTRCTGRVLQPGRGVPAATERAREPRGAADAAHGRAQTRV